MENLIQRGFSFSCCLFFFFGGLDLVLRMNLVRISGEVRCEGFYLVNIISWLDFGIVGNRKEVDW